MSLDSDQTAYRSTNVEHFPGLITADAESMGYSDPLPSSHTHWELSASLSGTQSVWLDRAGRHETRSSPGELLLINGSEPHRIAMSTPTERPARARVVFLSHEWINGIFESINVKAQDIFFVVSPQKVSASLWHWIEELFLMRRSSKDEPALSHECLANAIALHLASLIPHSHSNKLSALKKQYRFPGAIRAAKVFMRSHLGNPDIALSDLAASAGLSKFHFLRTFKLQNAGQTPAHYLEMIRVQAAMARLRHSKKSIVDISIECGFRELSTFYRAFRRQLGVTPRKIEQLKHEDLTSYGVRAFRNGRIERDLIQVRHRSPPVIETCS